jgi:uncharacterized RDD family membrane protein YckC
VSKPPTPTTYSGLWRRAGGFLIDSAILLPWSALRFWLGNKYRVFEYYYFLPDMFLALWFNVYLVKRFGGTPGRLLMKTKIKKVDGSAVDYKAAVLRYAVVFILMTLSSLCLIDALFHMSDSDFTKLDPTIRLLVFLRLAPTMFKSLGWATQAWIFSEFIVILTNKKRQSFEDLIAQTVIVNTDTKKT